MASSQSPPGSSHPHGLHDPLTPGLRVGGARYILKRALGRGPTTVVWLARDFKLEQDVALKILPDALLQDRNAVERLKRETSRNLQLAHPHIVRTCDFIQDYGFAAIAMEYVDGWSLAALQVDRPQHRYSLEEVTPWVRQLCSALTYAHTEVGILHLALKPSNLLLNSREQLKLADFGIARSLRALAAPADAQHAAAVLGCMSPQQALGEKPSVLDDVYGLGATIYALLTGTPPFYKGQVLAQICDRPPPTMTERLMELGVEDSIALVVEDTVALCLAKDPAKRPQSISQVLQLLERSDVPAPVAPPPPPKPPPTVAPPPPPPVLEAKPPIVPEPVKTAAEAPAPAEARPPASRRTFLVAGATAGGLALLGTAAWLWPRGPKRTAARTSALAGSLDAAFNAPTNSDYEIRVVLEQPDRKILVGGMFTAFGEGVHRGIARLEADGSLDTTFTVDLGGQLFALALQPDGHILMGGSFVRINGRRCRRIARLKADGALDTRFTTKAGVNGDVRAIAIQPDGRIVVAGNFTTVGTSNQSRITRLYGDGARDTTFNPGRGASGTIWTLALQPDGKMLAAGNFATFDRQSCGRVARLNTDGGVDADFNAGSGADREVYASAVQPDGKILVAGDFTRINLVERNRIARLNPDGNVDQSFNPGTGPNTGVRCVALQPDGKILIGGIFTSVAGVDRGRVARLNADGTLDAAFNTSAGASEVVRWVAPQADGRVLVVGGFSQFAGKDYVRLARLHGDSR